MLSSSLQAAAGAAELCREVQPLLQSSYLLLGVPELQPMLKCSAGLQLIHGLGPSENSYEGYKKKIHTFFIFKKISFESHNVQIMKCSGRREKQELGILIQNVTHFLFLQAMSRAAFDTIPSSKPKQHYHINLRVIIAVASCHLQLFLFLSAFH